MHQRPISKSSTSRILTRSTAASHRTTGTEVDEAESCGIPKGDEGQGDESTVSPESSVETGSQVTEVPQSKVDEPESVEERAASFAKPDQHCSIASSTLLDLCTIPDSASTLSRNSTSNADMVCSSVIAGSPSPTIKVSSDIVSVFAPSSVCHSVTSTPDVCASGTEPSPRDMALRDACLRVTCSTGFVVAATCHDSISSYPDGAFAPSSSSATSSVVASSSVCSKSNVVGQKQLPLATARRRVISSQESGSKTLLSLSSESHLCGGVSDLFPSSSSLSKIATAASSSAGIVSAALPVLTSTTPASALHDSSSNLTASPAGGMAPMVSSPVARSSCTVSAAVTSPPVISSICANNQTLLSHLKRPLTVSNSDQSLDLKRLKASSLPMSDSLRGPALSTVAKPVPSLKAEDAVSPECLSNTPLSQTSPSVSAAVNDSRHHQPQMSSFPPHSGTLANTSPNSAMAFPRPAYSRSPDVVTTFFPRGSTPSNHLSPKSVSTTTSITVTSLHIALERKPS